jgi:hypothetical protein
MFDIGGNPIPSDLIIKANGIEALFKFGHHDKRVVIEPTRRLLRGSRRIKSKNYRLMLIIPAFRIMKTKIKN